MRRPALLGTVLLLLAAPLPAQNLDPVFTRAESVPTLPGSFAQRADVQAFIREMSAQHGFAPAYLNGLFAQTRSRDDIIARMNRPAEKTKPWRDYRKIFLDEPRIDGGVAFWRQHAATLARAENDYGVPAEIIIAILGVETRYGGFTGRDGVLEALATLAFDYPKRAPFFRKELENYLLLTREEGIEPLSLTGSYAGAMGMAQFMPSSYRAYAVDFDGDGQRDLWHNPVDAIGCIANYLSRHGWQRNAAITAAATVTGQGYKTALGKKKPEFSLDELRAWGIMPQQPVAAGTSALLLELEGAQGLEYWLGFNNFYVITRYNTSPLYAMAVHQLGQAIRQRYAG